MTVQTVYTLHGFAHNSRLSRLRVASGCWWMLVWHGMKMVLTSRNLSGTTDGWPERTIIRPITVRQVAQLLNKDLDQVLADLPALNQYLTADSELSDEIVVRLGNVYRIHFKVVDHIQWSAGA